MKTLSVLAGLLFIAGFVPYIRAIVRRETKPAKASWLIWLALDVIAGMGMFAAGALNYQIVGATFGASVVVVLSLKYGSTPGWTRLDKFCLGGAALGIILWWVFHDPAVGIVTVSVVALLGSIPTFASAWRNPSNENKTAWTIYWISCVCAVIAIPRWTLADAVQPFMFFAIESVMMCLLYIHPWFMMMATVHNGLGAQKSVVIRKYGSFIQYGRGYLYWSGFYLCDGTSHWEWCQFGPAESFENRGLCDRIACAEGKAINPGMLPHNITSSLKIETNHTVVSH